MRSGPVPPPERTTTRDDSGPQVIDGRHRTRPRASVTEAPIDDAALLLSAFTPRSDGADPSCRVAGVLGRVERVGLGGSASSGDCSVDERAGLGRRRSAPQRAAQVERHAALAHDGVLEHDVAAEHLLADRLLQDLGDVAWRGPVVLELQVLGHGVLLV